MPELPEVETTRQSIAPHVVGQRVRRVVVRNRALRWPVPRRLDRELPGSVIHAVDRRAKYLLCRTSAGTMILHLGMSGSLRLTRDNTPLQPHDHVDVVLANRRVLRLRDPRRFGAVLWTRKDPCRHVLLARLGPEPLEAGFDGDYLYHTSRGRRRAVRDFLLDGRVVAGVGNIYANEAAHRALIDPRRSAGRISRERYRRLSTAVREILTAAITSGGTSLRDYVRSDGEPGTFGLQLEVYGRTGEPCRRCAEPIRRVILGARSAYYCPACQR